MQTIPNPGHPLAVAMGCTCPRLDNSHGAGYMGMPGIFVYNETCPVHGVPQPTNETDEKEGTKP